MSVPTGSTVDVDDIKKVSDQISQTFLSVTNHLVGIAPNSADTQKSIDKFRSIMSKGFTDVSINNIYCIMLFYLFKFISIFEFN